MQHWRQVAREWTMAVLGLSTSALSVLLWTAFIAIPLVADELFRILRMGMGSIGAYVQRCWYPPDVEDYEADERHREEVEWGDQYLPERDSETYPTVAKYAERYYEQMLSVSDGLDKRFDDIIKTAAALGAILAAIARVAGSNMLLYVDWLLPSIALFLLAVILSARGRRPATMKTPITPRLLLKLVEHSLMNEADPESHPTERQVQATIAATYHVAADGMNVLNKWKAEQLKRTTFCFCFGLALLPLVFFAAPTNPSSSQNPERQIPSANANPSGKR
jgi:hypothetical protein